MNFMSDESTREQLLSLEERVLSLEQRLADLEALIKAAPGKEQREIATTSQKKASLKEFVNEKAPRNTRETTLAIAFYLENSGIVPFNVQDLERGFRAGKIPPPKNINDMVNKNIKKGCLMEATTRKNGLKAWELTATGEREIESGFGKK